MTKIVPTSGEISISNLNEIKAFKAPWSEEEENTSVSELLEWFTNNTIDQGNTLDNRSEDALSTARGSSVMKIEIKIKAESNTTYDNSADGRLHITCSGGDEDVYKIEIDSLNGSDNIDHETTGSSGTTVFDFSSSPGLGGDADNTTGHYYKIHVESPAAGGAHRRMSLCVRPGIAGIDTTNTSGSCDFWLDADTDNPWLDVSQNVPLADGGAVIYMGRFEWGDGGNSSNTVWSNTVHLWSEPHEDGGGDFDQGVGCISGGYLNT